MRPMDPSSRRELTAVLALTMVGAVLRLGNFGHVGLSHFDEGIYALSGTWSLTPGGLSAIDPMVIPYAPPGFPILIGLAYLTLGVMDVSAILASTVCGIATIPVAGWVARRTFGPGAGAAASALVSGSLAHVAFSRKALTDAPFVLAWLIAIGLGGRFLERPGLGRAVAAGLAVGLAQNVKYNGWLLGVVLAGAAVLGLVRHSASGPDRRAIRTIRLAGLLLIAAAVALLLYAPWYQFVERHGGYAGLVRHHRSYLGGPGSWYPFWKQQLGQVVALSGGPAWDASRWVVAWLATAWALRADLPSALLLAVCGLLGGAIVSGASANLGWWIGLALTPWLVFRGPPAARMLGCWWLLLSILTPFYHPYARLWLPLGAAGWLMVAGVLVRILPRRPPADAPTALTAAPSAVPVLSRGLGATLLLAGAIGVWQQWYASPVPQSPGRFFQDNDTLRRMVQELPRTVPEGSEIHVLARRPVAFYLLLRGRYVVRLLSGFDDLARSVPEGAWAILDGAVLDPEARGRMGEIHAELVDRDWLDPVTLLDVEPGAAYRVSERGPIAVEVFRRRPQAPAIPAAHAASASRPH